MLGMLKNFARSVLALPYDGGIFKDKPSDTIEKWNWALSYKVWTVVVFYSEDCLSSELMLRSAMAFEPDVRNFVTQIYLSDRQPGVRELAARLGATKLPAVIFADTEGMPLRKWGTTLNPVDVLGTVQETVKAHPKQN